MDRGQAFEHSLLSWATASRLLVDAKEAYRVAHAGAYLTATGTETARKAAADKETSALRRARDILEVGERETYHRLVFLRGSAGERAED